MKTTFKFHQRVIKAGPRLWILLVIGAWTWFLAAGQATAAGGDSVAARTAGWSSAGADHAGQGGITVDPGIASNDAYPMDYDGGMGWEPGLGWDCGEGCPPSCRARGEILEFTRNHSGDSLTNAFPFREFNYQPGIRTTIDGRWDCTHGWEVVYAGLFTWQQDATAQGNANLNSTLSAGTGVDLSAFFGAFSQEQHYRSQLNSLESSYKCWGWDVIAVSWGARYINVLDQFAFRSFAPNNNVGVVQIRSDNNLIMGQFGLDLLYPLGRWSLDSTWKAAIGTNIGEGKVFVSNGGVPQISRRDRDAEFAAMIEGGTYVRYFVTNRLAVRGGYEMWYIYGVGLAPSQIRGQIINNQTGSDFRARNELLVHGASVGIEFGW